MMRDKKYEDILVKRIMTRRQDGERLLGLDGIRTARWRFVKKYPIGDF